MTIEGIMHSSLVFLGCVGGVTLLAGAVMGYIEAKRLSRRTTMTTSGVTSGATSGVTAAADEVPASNVIITPVDPGPVSHGVAIGPGVTLSVACDTTITNTQDLAKLLIYARDGLPVTFSGKVTIEGPFLDTLLKILAQK